VIAQFLDSQTFSTTTDMEYTMNKILGLTLLAGAIAMSGCATTGSKYACPHPHGVTCMAATDVYKATNNADEVVGIDPDEARKLAREGKPAGKVANPLPAAVVTDSTPAAEPAKPGVVIDGDTLALSDAPAQTYAMASQAAPSAGAAEPYRLPAKIMRIYIHPWEDEHHDLHMGGFLFTEIVPRRWSLTPGISPDADNRRFELLEAPNLEAAQEQIPKGAEVATPPSPPHGVVANPVHNAKGTSQ
jgi:conjugal transfer pilus assembly protein TraV